VKPRIGEIYRDAEVVLRNCARLIAQEEEKALRYCCSRMYFIGKHIETHYDKDLWKTMTEFLKDLIPTLAREYGLYYKLSTLRRYLKFYRWVRKLFEYLHKQNGESAFTIPDPDRLAELGGSYLWAIYNNSKELAKASKYLL